MTFASDNWAGASDKVTATLAQANEGLAAAYGNDLWTGRALDILSALFERDVAVFFVGTGSAANSLGLSVLSKPAGAIFCHVDAHIARDEAGAPLLFSPGSFFDTLDGPKGRICPECLAARLASYPDGFVHHGQPAVVSITNVNEIGQCYSASEIAEIAAVARSRGCALHMDGARFLNALAYHDTAPADLTWRAGVDVLSLGLTKCGAWCAEAVVFFDASRRTEAMFRHKQAAQLLSKNRFAAAQFVALLEDGHGLDLARHANRLARDLANVLRASSEASLLHEPQANLIFAFLSARVQAALAREEIIVAPWGSRSQDCPPPPHEGWQLCRFVTSFRTTTDDIETLAGVLG